MRSFIVEYTDGKVEVLNANIMVREGLYCRFSQSGTIDIIDEPEKPHWLARLFGAQAKEPKARKQQTSVWVASIKEYEIKSIKDGGEIRG